MKIKFVFNIYNFFRIHEIVFWVKFFISKNTLLFYFMYVSRVTTYYSIKVNNFIQRIKKTKQYGVILKNNIIIAREISDFTRQKKQKERQSQCVVLPCNYIGNCKKTWWLLDELSHMRHLANGLQNARSGRFWFEEFLQVQVPQEVWKPAWKSSSIRVTWNKIETLTLLN